MRWCYWSLRNRLVAAVFAFIFKFTDESKSQFLLVIYCLFLCFRSFHQCAPLLKEIFNRNYHILPTPIKLSERISMCDLNWHHVGQTNWIFKSCPLSDFDWLRIWKFGWFCAWACTWLIFWWDHCFLWPQSHSDTLCPNVGCRRRTVARRVSLSINIVITITQV